MLLNLLNIKDLIYKNINRIHSSSIIDQYIQKIQQIPFYNQKIQMLSFVYLMPVLILISLSSQKTTKGYIFTGQSNLPNVKSISMISPDLTAITTQNMIFTANIQTPGLINRTIINSDQSIQLSIGVNYSSGSLYYAKDGNILQLQTQKQIKKYNVTNDVNDGTPMLKVKDTLLFTSFQQIQLNKYNITSGQTQIGPDLKSIEYQTSLGTQIAYNAEMDLLYICDGTYFMIVDYQSLQVLQRQTIYEDNAISITTTLDGQFVQIMGATTLTIFKYKLNTNKYIKSVNIDFMFKRKKDVDCSQATNLCTLVIGDQTNNTVLKVIDTQLNQQIITSKLETVPQNPQFINNSTQIIAYNRTASDVKIYSILNLTFKLKVTYEIIIQYSGNTLDFIGFSNNGLNVFYTTSGNETLGVPPVFEIWDLLQDQQICSVNLTQRIFDSSKMKYNQISSLVYFLVDSSDIFVFSAENCEQLGHFTSTNLSDYYILSNISIPEIYAVEQNSQQDLKVHRLDSKTLQQISQSPLNITNVILITSNQKDKLLGTTKIDSHYYLILYNQNFQEEQRIQVICEEENVIDELLLTAGSTYFRVVCLKQVILYDSNTLQIISNYYTDADMNGVSKFRETSQKQLVLFQGNILYYCAKGNIISKYKLSFANNDDNTAEERLNRQQQNSQAYIGVNFLLYQNNTQLTMVSVQRNISSPKLQYLICSAEITLPISRSQLSSQVDDQLNLNQQCKKTPSKQKSLILQNLTSLSLSCNQKFVLWNQVNQKSFQKYISIIQLQISSVIYQDYLDQNYSGINSNSNDDEQFNYAWKPSCYLDCQNNLYYPNLLSGKIISNNIGRQLKTVKPSTIKTLGDTISIQDNGNYIAIQGLDDSSKKVLEIWDRQIPQLVNVYSLPIPQGIVKKMKYSRNGNTFLILQNTSLLLLRDEQFVKLIVSPVADFYFIQKTLVLTIDLEGSISYVDLSTNQTNIIQQSQSLNAQYSFINISPNSKYLVGFLSQSFQIQINSVNSANLTLLQTIKSNHSSISTVLIDDSGNLLSLDLQSQTIQTWSMGQCLLSHILEDGFCVCPDQSKQNQEFECTCTEHYRSIQDNECKCWNNLTQVKGICCPLKSVDYIDGSCICKQSYILQNFACICEDRQFEADGSCQQCSFFCASCTQSGITDCLQISTIGWIVFSVMLVIIIVLLIVMIIMIRMKIKSHRKNSELRKALNDYQEEEIDSDK